jgi:acyl-CoA synthetase (AMP-forming)/AMP-acid ligase II
MALVLLAAMSVGCAAPLNPKYREDEFRFYLDDLNAAALITVDGATPAAHAAAPAGTIAIDLHGEGLTIDVVARILADEMKEDIRVLESQAHGLKSQLGKARAKNKQSLAKDKH